MSTEAPDAAPPPDDGDLVSRFGSARHPDRDPARRRPAGTDDATVAALGKLSEALEVIEQARGALYQFHRLSGRGDLALQEAVDLFRAAGLAELADEIDHALVGRDVVPGRWTFQLVEDYDDTYWQVFRAADARARDVTGVADRHLYEAELKVYEQVRGSAAD